MDYKVLIKEFEQKKFKPIYLFQGEEPYYIDILAHEIQKHALEEHEQDFNQTIVYGRDAEPLSLISELKGYPMMAERRLVILREAQDFKHFEALEKYVESPMETTIFVIAHKYKKIDSRTKISKLIAKNGVVFTSEKVKEYKLIDWVSNYLKDINYTITPKACSLLVESLGNDLSKITNELDKLSIVLQKGTNISEIHIEENIGISKDYNVFELSNAVRDRDVPKAMRIVRHFEHNPKAAPLIQVVSTMFNLFSNLMKIHFSTNKSADALASSLRLHPFAVKELLTATKIYPPKKISANIAILHEYDLKSKGVGNATFSEGELMRELIFKLMH
jgi:DNA polymerase III subunit delta